MSLPFDHTCRLIEEVKEETGVALETDDVYMSTTFEAFIHTLVGRSRGGEVAELEYDAVSIGNSYECSLQDTLVGRRGGGRCEYR